MAFMMPVMKNNYDIYKDKGRSRKTSESSNGTGANSSATPNMASAMGINPNSRGRQRMKSESFASSPSHTYRMQMQRCQSQKTFPRNSSRTSTGSAALSPTRSFCQPSQSPPKQSNTTTASANNQTGSQNDISKFHLRLVDKLRKSFRKDSAKQPSAEPPATLLNDKSSSSSSSSSTLKTEVQRYDDLVVQKTEKLEDTKINPSSSPYTLTDQQQPPHKTNSLASQLGKRFTAPLIKANIKRCHKKFTHLQLHHYHQPLQHSSHTADKSSVKLLTSTSTLELFQQDCENFTKLEHKPLMKNMQKTAESIGFTEKSNKKSPEKSAAGLRQARRRKRLTFMRRSTKSAPG
ncbi:hypothetical protein FF38_08105 [Lucilia cuprina]|uniref:Uncharacterized protein n=1 Tax=Lucilia cuprina TaxID=7375 RepID=A0A0L0CKU7_LUCCU|nr:hypothetical protein FF38_08105 [Lucilia cuprina]